MSIARKLGMFVDRLLDRQIQHLVDSIDQHDYIRAAGGEKLRPTVIDLGGGEYTIRWDVVE